MSKRQSSTEIPEYHCPVCHYAMDRASSAFGNCTPGKGDLSVCLKCGAVSEFDKDLILLPLSDEGWEDLKENSPDSYQEIKMVQSAIKKLFTDKN